MAEREWLPDPTGRHPFRSRKNGEWTDLVAASADGQAVSSDAGGGREARAHDRMSGAATPKPDKTWGRANLWALLGVIAVLGGLWAWITDYNAGQQRKADEAIDRVISLGSTSELEYCWSGTASSVDITMATISGGTSQAADRANDQCINAGDARPGTFAYISAQITSKYGGTIICQIKVDGVVVEETRSEGDYVIASCSGRV